LLNDGADIGEVAETKRKYWSKLVAEQQASGQKALPFCRERGISPYSFYKWRQRLQQSAATQFALLETLPTPTVSPDSALELVLRNGERLRIGNQVAAETLRIVLEAVRR
jgi:transposase-like protein